MTSGSPTSLPAVGSDSLIRSLSFGCAYLLTHCVYRLLGPKLSPWYRRWRLPYKTTPQAVLTLSRRVLGKLLAIRTMHSDFAWYHRKFRHEDAVLLCSCGKDKSPDHLVHCPRMRRLFRQWPIQPPWPPTNTKEGIEYLQQLLSHPEDFSEFLRLAERA